MFYEFAPQCSHPESDWPIICKIETLISGVIAADFDELFHVSEEHFVSSCMSFIEELDLLNEEENQRARDYLNSQKESIRDYVMRNHAKLSKREMRVTLVPNFLDYVRASKDFATYLQQRPLFLKDT